MFIFRKLKLNKNLNLNKLTQFQKSTTMKTTLSQIINKSNIFLGGPPGSGKTVLSVVLGKMLKMDVYDVDNDHLENDWKTTVSKKLEQLGEEAFLKAEEGK